MTAASTAITNVRVFDGQQVSEPRTVVVEGALIASATTATTTVDGQGGTLLPGLIDAHVHLIDRADLAKGADTGVTTMLDMASHLERLAHLHGLPDLPDFRSAGIPASAAGGMQTTRMGFPLSSIVSGPADAERFVTERLAEGSDYIKIIVEDPHIMGTAALDAGTIAALVASAHAHHQRVFAHVTTVPAVQMATNAGVDVLTHAPIDAPLDDALVAQIKAQGIISVPTLVMMRSVAALALPTHRPGSDFGHALASVRALHHAGVPVLAGTDASSTPNSPFRIAHGTALHEELELFVSAGLSPTEALQSATIRCADLLDLSDRGAIIPGRRADLVLVTGDPTADIRATRAIQGVWIAGTRVR